ncbi:MAG TPA: hypothetical protein VFA57_05645 [Pseudolabrys sp.]|nr:hypothetical protein [Pseudolabrys sp.]
MILRKPVMALAIAVLFPCWAAQANAWSFCIAVADAQKRIYVSTLFPFTAPGSAEPGFAVALARQQIPHDAVQCPRADDEQTAVTMRDHAIEVNRLWGRDVINFRWSPRQ